MYPQECVPKGLFELFFPGTKTDDWPATDWGLEYWVWRTGKKFDKEWCSAGTDYGMSISGACQGSVSQSHY